MLPKLNRLSCLYRVRTDLVSNILTSKTKKRVDFKFYFYDLEITCKNDLDNFEKQDDYLINIDKIKYFKIIVLNNYHKLSDVVINITKVNFNHLISFFKNKQIDAFFNKFVNVQKLVVNNRFNREQLIKFLKIYQLHSLRFIDCKLDQQFLNQLPDLQKKIHKLKIQNINEKQRFDLDFILKFKSLKSFKTNLIVPCSLISELLDASLHLAKFKFNELDVMVRDQPLSRLISVSKKLILFKNSNELKSFLNRLDLFSS